MKYTVKENGDWLEKEAADFIISTLPCYESIWQIFIGHQGNGIMAEMKNITKEDEFKRKEFSEHHYTILESLFFMQKIVEDESRMQPIDSFDTYRKVINQIMAFQAYSGRLRDNIEKCYLLLANESEASKALNQLEPFYNIRHTFIHGRKVPFLLDKDNLFMTPDIKTGKNEANGFSKEELWSSVLESNMNYLEDSLSKSINALTNITNGLLCNLLSYVIEFIKDRELSIIKSDSYNISAFDAISGSTENNTVSGVSGYSGKSVGAQGFQGISMPKPKEDPNDL